MEPFVPAPARNAVGYLTLRALEATLSARALARLRARLWSRRVYLYVTPPPLLVRQALAPFPADVKRLCRGVAFHRFDARGGGGFYNESNEIWLAAGVETYEALRQARLSARHELFHFVCWNHPHYRADEDRGFPLLIGALEEAKAIAPRFPRYASWVRDAFLHQGDHANVVEYFADIPTNFPDPRELPPSLAAHFAPLLTGAEPTRARPSSRGGLELAEFQRLIAPER
jgi:hypothetical protein